MAQRLVVVSPAIHSTKRRWFALQRRLEQMPGYTTSEARWCYIEHRTRAWTPGSLRALARRFSAAVGAELAADPEITDIVLVGHSVGGLVVRAAYIMSSGAGLDGVPADWVRLVSKLVLFASPNRGIDPDRLWWSRLVATFARILPHPHLRVEDALQGSQFLTDLRLAWIRLFANWDSSKGSPPVAVQLLGDEDGIVHASDSKDVRAFPNGHYIEIPFATHSSLYRLAKAPDPELRFSLIKKAFSEIWPKPLTGELPSGQKIVMLVHGIRASNVDEWLDRLSNELKSRPDVVDVIRPTYGYFSALKFAVPNQRRRNIRFFQDSYTEALASHPTASFSVIAHSNGTYLLGHSLVSTREMKFNRAVLLGSVLPPEFEWSKLRERGQVGSVRNERASRDWPVALLCSALRALRMRDIGTAGFSGFLGQHTREIAYHPGGHGAGLAPSNHSRLVAFVLDGVDDEPEGLTDQPGWFRQASNFAPYATALGVIGSIALIMWSLATSAWTFGHLGIVLGILVLSYILLDIV